MRHFSIVAGICLTLTPAAALAQDNWGRFLGEIEGIWIESEPRAKFRLTSDFSFHDPSDVKWTAPSGAIVDGASIPRAFWTVIGGPFTGNYFKASVIHDHYCNAKTRSDTATHRSFYHGMLASGVPEAKAKLMYWAVRTFGPRWRTVSRVVVERDCSGGSCKDMFVSKLQTVALKSPDLGNPVVLKLATAKTNAILKTLKTSDGNVLDIGAMGNVGAGLDSIDANSQSYREIFNSADVLNDPSSLGILSDDDLTSFEEVPGWENNVLPTEEQLIGLETQDLARDDNAFFIKTPGDLGLTDRLDIDQQMLTEARIQIEHQ